VAQLIVAKHRNGPTGTIELIFLESLAKFENARRDEEAMKRRQTQR